MYEYTYSTIRLAEAHDTLGDMPNVISMTDVIEIVGRFCPVFSLHHEEKFRPCSTEWFMAHSQLVEWRGRGNKFERAFKLRQPSQRILIPYGKVTEESIADVVQSMGEDCDLRLNLNKDYREGVAAEQLDSEVPVYAYCKVIENTLPSPILEINYMTFYAHNGAYNLRGTGIQAGAHDGDWEHLTVRCTASGDLVALYFSAHRHGDGQWRRASDACRDSDTGRLITYVARNGHGLYPRPGTTSRIYGLANDQCSNRGIVWRPRRCVLLTHAGQTDPVTVRDRGCPYSVHVCDGSQQTAALLTGHDGEAARTPNVLVEVHAAPWLSLKLRWGSTLSPPQQRWFSLAEHPHGSHTAKRLLMPFLR